MITSILSLLIGTIPLDTAASFGVASAATFSCEVVAHKLFDVKEKPATLICGGVVAAVTIIKGAADSESDPYRSQDSTWAALAGTGLSVTLLTLRW